MKKLLTVFLVALMATSLTACGGTGNGTKTSSKELIVGTITMNGDFLPSEGFGNNSYDKNIRDLIHGYSPVAFTPEGDFVIDETVVKEYTKEVNADGDTDYVFTINDLKWNDGEPVTAKDYMFSLLLIGSPETTAAGCADATGENYVGYPAYHDGSSEYFTGIKLIDEKTFSFTVAQEKLPYFWELSWVRIQPFPMHTLAPDGDVVSDDNGTKFVGDMGAAVNMFANEYRYAPTVTSGPYKFISFENAQVKLEANENFAGNYQGKTPSIQSIIVKEVNATIDIDTLINGETDIIFGVVEGDKIEKAKATDTVQESTYPRNGYGNVPMHNDFGPTKEKEVRHAIAYILDKDELIQNILGGYGTTVNSDYGQASWTYQAKKAEIDATLTNYSLSLDKANAELDKSSFKFEKDGVTPWDATKAADGYWRYNAAGEELRINHLGTNDNAVTDTIEIQFRQNGPKVGMNITIERGDFAGLMDAYYYAGAKADKDRKYHTFNMAIGFADANDPYEGYYSEFAKTPKNPTNTISPELDEVMVRLRGISADDKEKFADTWLEYVQIWNDYLPMVPIYANQYYDFADADLEGFNTTPFASWAQIICDLSWK